MREVFKRLYCERRRALVVMVLLYGAAFLCILVPGVALDPATRWLGSTSAVLPHVALLIAMALIFRPLRHIAELCAALVFLFAVAIALNTGFAPAKGGPSALPAVTPFLLIFGLVALYHVAVLNRILPKRPRTLRSRATSLLPPERLFDGLTRTPDSIGPPADAPLAAADWVEPGRVMRLARFSNDVAVTEEHRRLIEAEPGHRVRMRYEFPKALPDVTGRTGSLEYRLRPAGNGTALEVTCIRDRENLRNQLFAWIDDAQGRAEDDLIARLEQSAGV